VNRNVVRIVRKVTRSSASLADTKQWVWTVSVQVYLIT